MISIPDPAGGTLAAALKLRADASQILGLDVDLVLGPVVGIEGQAARAAREDALVDMVDTGFVLPERVSSRVAAVDEQLCELDELEMAAGLFTFTLGAVA